MTHTVYMDFPIRPGTARRLGLRAPTLRPDFVLEFPQHLTAEQRTEIERAWLLHRGEWPTFTIEPAPAPRRRWWPRRNR